MYYKGLNSPELKELRGKVKYNVTCKKTDTNLIETINHTSHQTRIPQINYDNVVSSETQDIVSEYNIISLNDDGYLTFKSDTSVIGDYNDYLVGHQTNTTAGYTYHLFISYNKYTGELTGGIPFTYQNKEYKTNPDGVYIFEEVTV